MSTSGGLEIILLQSDDDLNTLTHDRDFVLRASQSPSQIILSSQQENNKRSSPKTRNKSLAGKRKPNLPPPTSIKINSVEDLHKWPKSDTASTADDSSPGRPHHQIGGAAPPMVKNRSKQKHNKANTKRSEEQNTTRTVRNNETRTAESKRGGDLKPTDPKTKNPKNTEMKPLKNSESKLPQSATDSKITDTSIIIAPSTTVSAEVPVATDTKNVGYNSKPEVSLMVETENDVIFDESFDIWYTLPKGVTAGHRGLDTASYEGGMHKIGTFTKVSEFFEFHRMLDWKTLPPNSVIAFCREGVKPIWEDPANSAGGRFLVKNFSRSDTEAIFTKTALGFFSGMLHDCHNYNLVSLHIRDQRRGNDIQLWRSIIEPGRLSPQVVKADILAFTSEENPAGITVAFVPNRESMQRNDYRLASKPQSRSMQQNNVKHCNRDNICNALDSVFGAGASAKNVSALYSRKNRPSKPLPSKPLPSEPLPSEPLPSEPLPSEQLPSEQLPSTTAALDARYGYNSWPYPNPNEAWTGAPVLAANVEGGEQAVAPGHSTWTIGLDPYYYYAAQGTPTAVYDTFYNTDSIRYNPNYQQYVMGFPAPR